MFNYDNTCPIINEEISETRDFIESLLIDTVETINPHLDFDIVSELMEERINETVDDITHSYEYVRQSNIDMRDAAETQLQELEEEKESIINDLQEEIDNLTSELEELKQRLKDE